MDERYYIRFKGRVLGPMNRDKTMELIRRGQVTRLHELSADGISWQKAEEFTDLYPSNSAQVAAKKVAEETAPLASVTTQATELPNLVWYAHVDNQNVGPVDENHLGMLIRNGRMQRDTMVWKEGMADWLAAEVALPSWFQTPQQRQPTVAATPTTATSTIEDDSIREVCRELGRNNVWIYIIGIFGVICTGLGLLGAGIALVSSILAPVGSGPEIIGRLLGAFLVVALYGWAAACFVQLIRYANAASVLNHVSTVYKLKTAAQRLSTFWLFVGVLLVASFTIVLALVLLGIFTITRPNLFEQV